VVLFTIFDIDNALQRIGRQRVLSTVNTAQEAMFANFRQIDAETMKFLRYFTCKHEKEGYKIHG
jgi:hypothetical protein